MIRVVHVLDPQACGEEGLMACAAACTLTSVEHELWIIGNRSDEVRARLYGLSGTIRLPRSSHVQPLLRRRLSALMEDRIDRPARPARSTIGQSWDLSTAAVVDELWARRGIARSTTLVRSPITYDLDGELATLGESPLVHTLSVLDAEAWNAVRGRSTTSAGMSMLSRRVRLLPPPLWDQADRSPPLERTALRESLGISHDQMVVGLLSDPPEAGNASQLCAAVGLDHVLGTSVLALVRRGTTDARRAARFTRANTNRWGLIAPDISLLELIVASDVCVADSGSMHSKSLTTCGFTAILAALGLGVPVVGVPEVLRGWSNQGLPPPPLLIGSANRGAGRVAPPIHAALADQDMRIAHAREVRAWLQQARTATPFTAELAGIWAEALQYPLAGSRYGATAQTPHLATTA